MTKKEVISDQDLFNKGLELFDQEEYEKSIIKFSEAIELNSNNAEPYYWRGNVYHSLNKYDQAIEDYNKAIELDPNDANYFYLRGVVHYHLKKYEMAYFDANKAIDLNPQNHDYRCLRNETEDRFSRISYSYIKIKNDLDQADKYFEENRLIEALNLYKKILDSDPDEKEFLGKDTMIRVNNIILKYKKIF